MAVRKRGNSYQVTYRCPGESSPRTETFQSEDEALLRDMQIKLAKKNGTFTPPVRAAKRVIQQQKDVTVQALMEEYVQVYGLKKWGNSFYTANIGLIENYIKPYIGKRYVHSLTVRDMDAYYTMLLEQPAVLLNGHKDTGAKISAHTVARIHKLLKSAFGKAVVWNYMPINPTVGATLPERKPAKRDAWSDDEAIQALNVCDNPTLHACMYLALGCSMRIGEILGLQWSNVHTEGSEPYLKVDKEIKRCDNRSIEALEGVHRSTIILKFPLVQPKLATTTLVLKAPKTESSIRTIYLPMAVVEELQKVKREQEEHKRLLGDEYHNYDLVIAQINGRPYESSIISKMFRKLINEQGLPPVVFHSLRHSSTSLKLKLSQGNIKAVQGDTGHAEARMVTDTYAHGFDADRKLIAHEMDSGFFSKVGVAPEKQPLDTGVKEQLKALLNQHPELLAELLAEGNEEQKRPPESS